jgi:hypothetical protein
MSSSMGHARKHHGYSDAAGCDFVQIHFWLLYFERKPSFENALLIACAYEITFHPFAVRAFGAQRL